MVGVDHSQGQFAYPAAAMGFGVGFTLAGVLLLLQELGLPDSRWPFVLPLILATVGVLVLISGFAGIHRSRQPAVRLQGGNRLRAERVIVEPERWIPPSDHAGTRRASGLLR